MRQANRRDADLAMIKNVLELQNLLNQLSDEARDDFIKGSNGAVVCVIPLDRDLEVATNNVKLASFGLVLGRVVHFLRNRNYCIWCCFYS